MVEMVVLEVEMAVNVVNEVVVDEAQEDSVVGRLMDGG